MNSTGGQEREDLPEIFPGFLFRGKNQEISKQFRIRQDKVLFGDTTIECPCQQSPYILSC
ncbi:MAG: hypothetical protein D3904_05920 [Candidatus Electrothrix sp. EH2]|nr:hypothetical protein [Candidatus Electrothrix sp. EH2]